MRLSFLNLTLIAIVTLVVGCTNSSNDFEGVLGSGSGAGQASININFFTPVSTSVVVKDVSSQTFLVSAVGQGSLSYLWTVNGIPVSAATPSFDLLGSNYPVGNLTVAVQVSDEVGSATQTWNVKINGPPSLTSSLPSSGTMALRQSTSGTLSVNYSDPNSDTLTYVWKLDGVEGLLAGTTSISTTYTPSAVDVGNHAVSVDVYDGPISDSGTYKVTRSWLVQVNYFAKACNDIENEAQTNKTCVYSGYPSMGDGSEPEVEPTDFFLRPYSVQMTSTGDVFLSDDHHDVVWFWNRTISPSQTMLGISVPFNRMRIVAGALYGSNGNSSSNFATRRFLLDPSVHWDGTHLYIAEVNANNRIVRVDSSGILTNVLTAGCTSPRQMDSSATDLYVACSGNHVIRQINKTTLVSTIIAGTNGTAGNPATYAEVVPTHPTSGQISQPYGLVLDENKSNLFFTEHNTCRVRTLNLAGTVSTYYGGSLSISPNRMRLTMGTIGGAACATVYGEAVNFTGAADARVNNPRFLSFSNDGHLLIGHDGDTIMALNLAGTAVTFAGTTLTAFSNNRVFGSGTSGYSTGGLRTSNFQNPFSAVYDILTGDYFITDYSNNRFRRAFLTANEVRLVAGNGTVRGQTNNTQATLPAYQEKANGIRHMVYDTNTGQLFYSDNGNHRIRVVSKFGEISQAAGTGTTGTGGELDSPPTEGTMNAPRGLALVGGTTGFGGHLAWVDTGNNQVRIWNRSGTSQTLFGVSVEPGRVETIVGNGVAGNGTIGSALAAVLNTPAGIAWDSVANALYVSDHGNDCIKRISSTGTISVAGGTCGSAGSTDGPPGVGRMNNPEGLAFYQNGVNAGILIADVSNNRVRFLRTSGSGLFEISGVPIAVGDANSVAGGGTYHDDGAGATSAILGQPYAVVALSDRFCFTNHIYHNVRCVKFSDGKIETAIGSIQGYDNSTPLFYPGTSINATNQNGVAAYTSGTAEVSLADPDSGVLNHPMGLATSDSKTLFVGEYYIGLVRKVRLP